MTTSMLKGLAAAVVVVANTVACGGGSRTPTTPTSPTAPAAPAGNTPSATATITIGPDGRVSPTTVSITRGGRVTFINSHNRAHDISSDPHPDHTDCAEMSQVGFLNPGESRTSGNFNTARTCGFHDHIFFEDRNLQGQIIIE